MGFDVFVLAMLWLDLRVFHRHSREPSLREKRAVDRGLDRAGAGVQRIGLALGRVAGGDSVFDGVFDRVVVVDGQRVCVRGDFHFVQSAARVSVPRAVLGNFGGDRDAAGVRVIRGGMLEHFAWILAVFGVLLIVTGVRLAVKEEEVRSGEELTDAIGAAVVPGGGARARQQVFARENGRRCMTPLFLVLLVVESTDLLFAFDSVPAIFGVTSDPFIVFTSNIFAILGLRALYFLLAGVMGMFRYLHYGLAAVLIFVGGKMIAEYFWKVEFFSDYPWASLAVIVGLLGVAVAASLAVRGQGSGVRGQDS